MKPLSDKINMKCPSCGGRAVFVGSGGYLTCSHIDCPEPDIDRRVRELKAENNELRELFVYFFGENYEELAKG